MKQLFRCDYCSKQGTAEEISKHEEVCLYNPALKNCQTCKHAESVWFWFKCKAGVEIDHDKYMSGCSKYENDRIDHTIEMGRIIGD